MGIPIASYFLKKEARALQLIIMLLPSTRMITSQTVQQNPKLLQIPERTEASTYLQNLSLIVVISYVSCRLNTWGSALFCDVLDCGSNRIRFLGFLESGILQKAQSNGANHVLGHSVIFSNLASVTPAMIAHIIGPPHPFYEHGCYQGARTQLPHGKLLHVSPYLAMAPGYQLHIRIPNHTRDASRSGIERSKQQTQKQAIENYLVPKMLVAGIITVTIASSTYGWRSRQLFLNL